MANLERVNSPIINIAVDGYGQKSFNFNFSLFVIKIYIVPYLFESSWSGWTWTRISAVAQQLKTQETVAWNFLKLHFMVAVSPHLNTITIQFCAFRYFSLLFEAWAYLAKTTLLTSKTYWKCLTKFFQRFNYINVVFSASSLWREIHSLSKLMSKLNLKFYQHLTSFHGFKLRSSCLMKILSEFNLIQKIRIGG